MAGGLGALADRLGVSSPTVHEWKSGKRQVPFERCVQIEQTTNGLVTCEMLRSDVNWAVLRGPAIEPAPAPAPPPPDPPATELAALPTRQQQPGITALADRRLQVGV